MPDGLQARAHHLGLAAQAVGILYTLALVVRGTDLASGDEFPEEPRDVDLPLVAPHPAHTSVEGRVAAAGGIDGQGAREAASSEHVLSLEHGTERQRGGHLRAVEEREALLRLQRQGRETHQPQGFDRFVLPPGVSHPANAEQHGGQVGKGREIARSADRAAGWYAGIDLVIQ